VHQEMKGALHLGHIHQGRVKESKQAKARASKVGTKAKDRGAPRQRGTHTKELES
jgi:hypothetical protein